MSQLTSRCGRVSPGMGWMVVVMAASMTVGGWAHAAGSADDLAGLGATPAADVAWQVRLPMGHLASVRSYQLIEGYVCATCSDGAVRTFRADTGEYLWTAQLAKELDTLYPPVVWHAASGDRLVVTLARAAVVLDPASGREMTRIRLPLANLAPVALSRDQVFQVGPQGWVWCLTVDRSRLLWQSGLGKHVRLAPVYAPAADAVVLADIQGNVGALGSDKTTLFYRTLDGAAQGWLAVDGGVVYIATSNADLHALDLSDGGVLWKYRLIDRPAGGPVVTRESVYQATRSGLHRIGLARRTIAPPAAGPTSAPATESAETVADARVAETPLASPPAAEDAESAVKSPTTAPATAIAQRPTPRFGTSWIDPEAVQFLAEWPQGTVVLHANGRLALVNPVSGKISEFADSVTATEGLPNPYNDAVLLTNAHGEVRCIRPMRTQPLTLAAFRAPAGRVMVREKKPDHSATPPKDEPAALPVVTANDAASAPAESGEEAKAATVPGRTSDQILLLDPLRSERRLRK
ncbi:MAG: PQQ-binding-like beta-propeller repeat protein [Phycisphaerae bacterium]|nr:PQQ-binding-like beta-propeller repeat protein [Phycisphaerae bacterium]